MYRLLAVIAFSILTIGCTANLGYKFADTLIEWKIKDYVDLTSAQEEAKAVIAQAQDEAKSEADDILNKARQKVSADRERMLKELEGQVGDLAILTAEKIMEREVTEKDHDALVASVIKQADIHA